MVVNPGTNYNCSGTATYGGRGVTVWGPVSFYLAPGGGNYTWAFTGTHPKCYQKRDNCNVTYTIHTGANSQSNDVGPIKLELNKHTSPPRLHDLGNRYHSKIAGHDLTETIDIGSQAVQSYHDTELNTLTFTNDDPNVGVWINDFRIVRVYEICGMNKEDCGCCIGSNPVPAPCGWPECNPSGYPPCGVEQDTGEAGNLDYTRKDYACNTENCGNRLSYIGFGPDDHHKVIQPNQTADWTWTNPADIGNYVSRSVCFFNLNNVTLSSEPAPGNDVKFSLKVNNSGWVDFYHSKLQRHSAHSVDLANHSGLSAYYNDNPGASNTLYLHLDENAGVSFYLCDGCDAQECPPCEGGRINIYRIYETVNNCKDNFDSAQDDFMWEIVEVNGGTVNETGGYLQVTVPSGSDVWAQAGYVTKHAYNLREMTATVKVDNFNALDEMILQIGNTKTINSDPHNEDNWYRILKSRYDSKVYVQNKIGGVKSDKAVLDYAGTTGKLTISISTGSIAFYENEILRYAEPFALPSYKCYVYIFTSTLRSRSSGTDQFDNFEVYPTATATTAFKDDFQDENYNGWTVDSGSWQIINKQLRATSTHSHIHVNTSFSSNRHVKVDIQTLTAGDPWNVGRLMVKEENGNNNVYALIKTDGVVELAWFKNGQQTSWQVQSSPTISPFDIHVLAVSIVGTNAKVWVDGKLYIDGDHADLATISGYTGLYTPDSTALFDNIIIFDQ
jgi:hypothetical protein